MNKRDDSSSNTTSILEELIEDGDIILGRGNVISKIDIRDYSGSYPIYSSSSKGKGKMGEYGKYMFNEELITWSIDGGGDFFYRPKHKFSVTNVSGYMKVNKKKFDYRYVYEILNYQHQFFNFDYQMKAHPSVIRELYKIPILSISEQKKISSVADSINRVIESTQLQIKKLLNLKKSIMQKLLTKGIDHKDFKKSKLGKIPKNWEVKTVFELNNFNKNTVQTGPFGAELHASDYVKKGIPLILIRNIKDNGLDTNNIPKITLKDAQRLEKYRLQEGDIVFSRVGRVGSCFLTEKNQVGWVISGQTLRIRITNKDIYIKFLNLVLKSEGVQKKIIGESVGSTRTSINTKILENLTLPIPKIDEQKKIVSIMTSINKFIENKAIKLKKIQDLKKSIMQDLLTGKVKVKVN